MTTERPVDVMPLVDPERRTEVRFESEGLDLAGHLYLAAGATVRRNKLRRS